MRTRLAIALGLIVVGAAGAGGARGAVRITEPGADEILYGKTRIVAEATAGAGTRVAQVLFYLEPVPRPICTDTDAPFVCEFDAGIEFQGHTILARALDERGRFLGADTVETLAFPRPERVVERIIQVPVVAAEEDGSLVDLRQNELTCLYAGEPCEILDFEAIVERKTVPLSILVLVDVSPSVNSDRDEIMKALGGIVDHFPRQAKVGLAEFAGHYQRLGPFTVDREELRRQMLRLSINVSSTCLFRALDHALTNLGSRPGHRALFVVSDGEDTCDSKMVVSGPNTRSIGFPGVVAHVVELARSVAAPVYVYRLKEGSSARPSGANPGYEGLARETGGRLFATGDLYGIGRSFNDLIHDLETTWIVDVSLPAGIPEGRQRRLLLEMPDRASPRLRYPEYWDPDSMEMSKLGLLDSEIADARSRAALGLRSSRNREVLRKLVATARREVDEEARLEELDSILGISASFLLHGETRDQKAALAAIESLAGIEPTALSPLRPALAVYQKMETPERLKKRAADILDEDVFGGP
jgi:hypothetical protein